MQRRAALSIRARASSTGRRSIRALSPGGWRSASSSVLAEEGGDPVDNPLEGVLAHEGEERQRQDLLADPLGHAEIVAPAILQEREPVSGLPVNPGIDAPLAQEP